MSVAVHTHPRGMPFVIICATGIGLLGGCASSVRHSSLTGDNSEFVRRVDWSKAPEMETFADAARRMGNETYPRIVALLMDDASTAPQQVDIIFKHLRSGNTAETHLKSRSAKVAQVFVNADYFATNTTVSHWVAREPANFGLVLVHELVHVAQQCKSTNVPAYWVEGIADFVRFRLGYTNGWHDACCSGESPHYKSGYGCAGAFLLFVEMNHGTNVVRRLNEELRRGSYSDAFFTKATGEDIDALWAQFERTPAYTPAAARMNKLQKLLGYVDGKPPKDVDLRFETYVKSLRGGEETVAALHFIKTLSDKGRLPGFSKRKQPVIMKGERLEGSFVMPTEANPDEYPISRTVYCYDNFGDSTYYYVVTRSSAEDDWEISKAWCVDSTGRTVETYR